MLAGCSGGGSGSSGQPSTQPSGQWRALTDASGALTQIVRFDGHSNGNAQAVHLVNLSYGRLVRVLSEVNGVRELIAPAMVIEPAFTEESGRYIVETNAVTGQQSLIVLRDPNDTLTGGRDEFFQVLTEAEDNLPQIRVADVNTVGVFTMVPRNSAVVMQFDDLLDPASIDATTVRVEFGYPPTNPFEGRVLADAIHGGIVNAGGTERFYSTRVIFDTTISADEAFLVDPPLALNSTGLPASIDGNRGNIRVALPTRTNAASGQLRVLRNPSGHELATSGNGPVDLGATTQPVVRAFRSGGEPAVTADPFNGFLRDQEAPVVVGSNPVQMGTPDQVDGLQFSIPFIQFASQTCAQTPVRGDIIVQGGVAAELVADAQPPINGLVNDLQVRLILFPDTWPGPQEWELVGAGEAAFESPFDPLFDDVNCFVGILPRPQGYPANPTVGVDPFSSFRLRFSEPMDPSSLTAFDSMTLTRDALPASGPVSTDQFVIGQVGQTVDLRDFTFQPDLPLNHALGSAEDYFLSLATGQFTPRDLAGNSIEPFEEIRVVLEPSAPTQANGGRVSRFVSIDEEFPIAGSGELLLPEWGGQILSDPGRELIRPRPVVRSRIVIDRDQPTLAAHTPFSNGIVTPLSNFGSKMQGLWRYCDCGFSISDTTNMNIDVEGIGWSPAGGGVVADVFDEFEIRLAHSRWAPDEVIDAASLFPLWPNSGLEQTFTANILQNSEQVVVHPREKGYILNPADIDIAPSGSRIMPFPLNRGVPPEEFVTYTWRDTTIRTRAGTMNGGVDPTAFLQALGLPVPTPLNKYFPPNEVQTIGLPLLLEYRTYRDDSALGVNGFDINLAANSSSRPYFRAFSTGGIRQNGQPKYVDPDSESAANGGFNPGSPVPGAITYGRDNSVYLGSLDLVVRVSHAHSIWFRSFIPGEGTFGGRTYLPPILEPRPEDQPIGTTIDVAYRGAIAIEYRDGVNPPSNDNDGGMGDNPVDPVSGNQLTDYQMSAFTIDLYGDYYNEVDPMFIVHRASNANPGLAFLTGDSTWKSDVSQIADAVFYQVRLTFNSNIASGESPELSAFAISWTQ